MAATHGHPNVVHAIFTKPNGSNGARPSSVSVTGAKASTAATMAQRSFIVPNTEIRDSESYTALLHACVGGHASVVQALLDHGADTQVTTPSLKNALHIAAWYGHDDVMKCLLSSPRKPPLDALSKHGRNKRYIRVSFPRVPV